MSQLLLQYERIEPTTWAYLSSLLVIGLFFMFNRLWSVRNLDLILLIMLAPGLLLVYEGRKLAFAEQIPEQRLPADLQYDPAGEREFDAAAIREAPATSAEGNGSPEGSAVGEEAQVAQGRHLERLGFIWLLGVGAVWLIRLLLDPTMVRRPLLEPNLSPGGLAFIGCSLFVFLMANVLASTAEEQFRQGPELGPGYALLNMFPAIPTTPEYDRSGLQVEDPPRLAYERAARFVVIGAQLAVVIGIVGVGLRHFGNIKTGIGAATLYLMLPYTAQMTGRVDHVLPAAFLTWAVLCYRRPILAGMFLGLASGVVYYPLFLLPLWLSFYWQRGLMRFLIGVGSTLTLLVLLLFVTSGDQFTSHLQQMFGLWLPVMEGLHGIWGLGWDPMYRLPVLAAFFALSGTFALWPAQKNLGTLMSCSAAVMVAAQFWHGYGGGLYMAWYLPLLLLTVFRPNLEDRVALVVLGDSWFSRRRVSLRTMNKAALW